MAKHKNSRKKRQALSRSHATKRSAFTRKSRFFLPWPIITFILASIGVLLIGWTFQTQADDISVTAKVSAPLPSGPAVITSPGDGTHFSAVPITVSGTCPLDTYIKLYRNDFFSGTVICTSDGNFTLDIDLFPGANVLLAKVYNITDDEGPQGTPITVYYDVPQQPTGGGSSSGTNVPASPANPSNSGVAVAPFTLKTDFDYKGYKVGQTIELVFEATGGTTPYALNIEWGDGTNTVLSQKDSGKVSVSHRYKAVGNGNKGSYVVKISGSDLDGRQSYLQLFLIVSPSGVPGFVSNTLPSGPIINPSWLKLIWPAYLIVLLMAFSFWLGEREELAELKNKRSLRRRHI